MSSQREPGIKPHPRRWACKQRREVVRVHAEIDALEHVERARRRRLGRLEERHDHPAHDRAAGVERLGMTFHALLGGAVEDHAHGVRVPGLRDQNHGLAEIGIGELGLRHQQRGVRRLLLLRRGPGGEDEHGEENGKLHGASSVRKVIE